MAFTNRSSLMCSFSVDGWKFSQSSVILGVFFEDSPSLVVGQREGFVSRLWVSRYLAYFRPLTDRNCLRRGWFWFLEVQLFFCHFSKSYTTTEVLQPQGPFCLSRTSFCGANHAFPFLCCRSLSETSWEVQVSPWFPSGKWLHCKLTGLSADEAETPRTRGHEGEDPAVLSSVHRELEQRYPGL